MCSTQEVRLARLRAAIDEVALAAQADPGEHADPEELAERLAGLWAMIAELDPGLAARLRGYCPDTSLRVVRDADLVPGPATRDSGARRGQHYPPRVAGPPMRRVTSRRSRLRSWRSPRGATAPGPGAPRWS